MGLVSFFTDLSTEMVLGVLPLFIVNNLGASKPALGAIEGFAELTGYGFRIRFVFLFSLIPGVVAVIILIYFVKVMVKVSTF